MKKTISLILALIMCLGLFAGCSDTSNGGASQEPNASGTGTDVAEPSNNGSDDIDQGSSGSNAAGGDFVWNGQKEVWSVLPTTQAEGLVVINDSMGAILEEQGWKYVKKDAEGDPGNQVTFIETAIASGTVGAIMCAAMAVDLLEDVAIQCKDAGIVLVYLGASPNDYEINGCVYTSYALTGYYAIEMIEAWAEQNNPPSDDKGIPVALDVYDDIEDGQYRSNAFRDRTDESDILYVYNTNVTYGDDAQNQGYAWAENMMTANPDLRIFVCYEPDCMVGVVSYLNDYCDAQGIDKTEFCVVNCYEDEATYAEYDKAVEDPSSTVYKGYVTYGDSMEDTGAALATIILGSTDGTWGWNEIFWDSIHSYPTNYMFDGEWSMGDENPGTKYEY